MTHIAYVGPVDRSMEKLIGAIIGKRRWTQRSYVDARDCLAKDRRRPAFDLTVVVYGYTHLSLDNLKRFIDTQAIMLLICNSEYLVVEIRDNIARLRLPKEFNRHEIATDFRIAAEQRFYSDSDWPWQLAAGAKEPPKHHRRSW